jgi:hypothetical protein
MNETTARISILLTTQIFEGVTDSGRPFIELFFGKGAVAGRVCD